MKLLVLGASSPSGRAFVEASRIVFLNDSHSAFEKRDLLSQSPKQGSGKQIVETISEKLASARPTHIVNFLGSFSNDFETDVQANVVIPQALLEAAKRVVPRASILLIGSAAEYGNPLDPLHPVHETHPCRPLSVYGVTKHMQSLLVTHYAATTDLSVKLARAFNILSPMSSERLFIGKIYRQIEEIRSGVRKAVQCGDLSDVRDYYPLEYVINDYLKILLRGETGEVYNVCSGSPITMRQLLEDILTREGLAGTPVVIDESLPRSVVPAIFGSRTKVEALS
jgi:nucleoside-diphosphate-sugar epimerase